MRELAFKLSGALAITKPSPAAINIFHRYSHHQKNSLIEIKIFYFKDARNSLLLSTVLSINSKHNGKLKA
jgi:hypothetical protein